MEVQVELSKIIINEAVDQQIIVLKELGGDRSFPIVIGMTEALAIERRLKGIELPRPMTHDLLASVIEQMDGRIEKVVISDLANGTFYALLHVDVDGNKLEIDSRPSDAIALSAGMDVRLFVDEEIFQKTQM
jgi:hypothetical protein